MTDTLTTEPGVAELRQENADLRAKLAAAVRVVATAYPTTADQMTAVIHQISEITHVPAETLTVWSGYDDDERGFPLFTTREQAQAYAEQQFRKDCVNWGNQPEEIGEIKVWRRDGWFPTKDLGRVDADGYFYHMGRADDVIISAGWTMSAVEIEDV